MVTAVLTITTTLFLNMTLAPVRPTQHNTNTTQHFIPFHRKMLSYTGYTGSLNNTDCLHTFLFKKHTNYFIHTYTTKLIRHSKPVAYQQDTDATDLRAVFSCAWQRHQSLPEVLPEASHSEEHHAETLPRCHGDTPDTCNLPHYGWQQIITLPRWHGDTSDTCNLPHYVRQQIITLPRCHGDTPDTCNLPHYGWQQIIIMMEVLTEPYLSKKWTAQACWWCMKQYKTMTWRRDRARQFSNRCHVSKKAVPGNQSGNHSNHSETQPSKLLLELY